MFIDYLPLMLVNMAAGLFLLAGYVYKGLDSPDQKEWAGGFLISGIVALICGFHMTFNWPLPASYNVAFGEMSVLLGVLFLGAGISLAKGLSLKSLAAYALFSGIAAVIVGLRIIDLGLTKEPLISGIGFVLTGLSGILALPAIYWKNNKAIRIFVCLLLIASVFIWLRTGYQAYWSHLKAISAWKPAAMR